MTVLGWIIFFWFLLTLAPPVFSVILGAIKIHSAAKLKSKVTTSNFPMIEILVPIKGVLPDQETILESLLRQDYPSYNVIFLIENQDDPADLLIDALRSRFPHAKKVITGAAGLCGQKNHNLVHGIRNLAPNTEIIVFCDSSNMVGTNWLTQFTEPIRTGVFKVVTTFRTFDPTPATIWGISQAIYSAFLLLLIANKPKPWGGATAIERPLFNRLDVIEEWSRNVIDDLTLGNILDQAGIPVFLDPKSLLRSPLPNQSLGGFIHYMDRQILFPKWTNPIIWGGTLFFELSLTAATVIAVTIAALFPYGLVSPILGWSSFIFIMIIFAAAVLFWRMNSLRISLFGWLASFLPFIFVTAFVYSRSLFRNHIDWHGKRYYPGKGGVVLCVDKTKASTELGATS